LIIRRSKLILESDETLKDTEALKKTLEHFDIINKDLIQFLLKIILNQLIVLIKN
jgi:molecular chaperone GrpE